VSKFACPSEFGSGEDVLNLGFKSIEAAGVAVVLEGNLDRYVEKTRS